MRILAFCSACMREAMESGPPAGTSVEQFWARIPKNYVDIEGDFSFRIDCPRNHNETFYLDVPQHEVLFDAGVMSLERGAYREAVFSFAACRERFVERYLWVIAHARGRDFEAIERCWKALDASSERQVGAFFWMGFVENGLPPEDVQKAERWAKFRNRVVHRGVFPSRQQTIEYGEYLWTLIRDHEAALKGKFPESHDAVNTRPHLLAGEKMWKSGYNRGLGGMTVVTVLGSFEKTFEAALARFRKGNGWTIPLEDITAGQLLERLGVQLERMMESVAGARRSSE